MRFREKLRSLFSPESFSTFSWSLNEPVHARCQVNVRFGWKAGVGPLPDHRQQNNHGSG